MRVSLTAAGKRLVYNMDPRFEEGRGQQRDALGIKWGAFAHPDFRCIPSRLKGRFD